MGTKNNPGPFDCYAKAGPDEPIFVLRAKDPLAPALVRLWAHVRRVYDSAKGEHDASKYSEAMSCALQMETWRDKQFLLNCICGHEKDKHFILQDFAGPGMKAHEPQHRHCSITGCQCPTFKTADM